MEIKDVVARDCGVLSHVERRALCLDAGHSMTIIRESRNVNPTLTYAFIGMVAGLIMGMVGVGGGAVIIVSLLLVAHLPQKVAQGTTLLVVAAPASLLAAYNYYRKGLVDVRAAIVILVAFLVFSFFGSELAVYLPRQVLRRGLGLMLLAMGFKLLVA